MAPGMFNPDLPLRLQQVISDCLEKDPDLRYQNAAGLRADLKRVKRDLESGRTASLTTASDPRTAIAASGERMANEGACPSPLTPHATVRPPTRHRCRLRRQQRLVMHRESSPLHW